MLRVIMGDEQLPTAFIKSILIHESDGDCSSVSPAGAIGCMQLMSGTARELGVNPWDRTQNIMGGILYLAQLYQKFGGDLVLTAAAYNAGPHREELRHGMVPAIVETETYVKRVIGSFMEWTGEYIDLTRYLQGSGRNKPAPTPAHGQLIAA
jgi:soluble lytic murein transglycosylase-like protein